MKYGELTLGQIEALVNKLGGMDGVRQLLAGKLVVKNLLDKPVFPVWTTVTLGTGARTREGFLQLLSMLGVSVEENAERAIKKRGFSSVTKKTEVDLVIVSAGELGCEANSSMSIGVLYKVARMLGLEPPSTEVMLQLCIEQGKALRFFKRPLAFANATLGDVFYIVNDEDGTRLCCSFLGDSLQISSDLWVFVLPRK